MLYYKKGMHFARKVRFDMDFTEFSLIYPNAAAKERHRAGLDTPDIDMFTLQELGLLEAFSLKSGSLSDFVTTDEEVMRYRMASFADMLACPELADMFHRLVPILTDILELRRLL